MELVESQGTVKNTVIRWTAIGKEAELQISPKNETDRAHWCSSNSPNIARRRPWFTSPKGHSYKLPMAAAVCPARYLDRPN